MHHKFLICFVVGTFATSGYPIAITDSMFRAAENEDEEGLERALEDGANKDAVNFRGWSVAHIAAFKGNVRLIEIMHEHQADVDKCDGDGNTPFLLAVVKGHTGAMLALLKYGANRYAKNRQGDDAEYLARVYSTPKTLELLRRKPKEEIKEEETGDDSPRSSRRERFVYASRDRERGHEREHGQNRSRIQNNDHRRSPSMAHAATLFGVALFGAMVGAKLVKNP